MTLIILKHIFFMLSWIVIVILDIAFLVFIALGIYIVVADRKLRIWRYGKKGDKVR